MHAKLVFELSIILFGINEAYSSSSYCGIVTEASQFIVNGTLSEKDRWPWIATIHKTRNDGYICGGVLVGPDVILTVSCEIFFVPKFNFLFIVIVVIRRHIVFKTNEERSEG